MALKIMQEVTEWSGFRRQPNHVYLMQGDKALAYSRWGNDKPFYFRNGLCLDRRYRKFREESVNRWGFDLTIQTEEQMANPLTGETWTVTGSKDSVYTVTLSRDSWSCSCPGYGFRGRCRHVDELKASIQQLG